MFCSKCGAEIKEGHKFCMNCGAPVAPRVVQPTPKAPEAPKTPKAPKAPKAPKVQKAESEISNTETTKKKGKAGTIVLIIVAALLVLAIVLIAFKLLWKDSPIESANNDGDDWAAISDGSEGTDGRSTEEIDQMLNDQLQQIISDKGTLVGESFDLKKGKKLTGFDGVMGSAIQDVSGDGVDDLIVVYADNNNIYADVYTVEGDSVTQKGNRVVKLSDFDYVEGSEILGGIYLKQTSDGWNLVADLHELAWMFADGTHRLVDAVSCQDHSYDEVGDYDYAGSDMQDEDYKQGKDTATKIGMSGVTDSLGYPYFVEDQDVTMIAAFHSELLSIAWPDIMNLTDGDKCGTMYVDQIDATDSTAASTLVKAYQKYEKTAEKAREKAEAEDSEYILPMSDQRKLTADDLKDIKDDAWMLKLARNEIFARYGREFDNEDLQNYFDSKDWYEPQYTAKEFDKKCSSLVSRMELDNADFIKKYEDKLNK